ncbi:MAG: RNA-binding protein [Thermoplasmata archaeon]|jgi:RNA binding exosome subunit|nr:RNA-binding protein [Thermoplasmata archaeon]
MAALRYHWIRLRATAHPTEDLAKVESAVRNAAGVADLAVQAEPLETHHGATGHLVHATLDKSRAVRDALGRILALPGAREELAATLDARTDDDGVFYLRLDKQEAYAGRLVLTRGEDAVQLRLKMEHYPATREAALESLKALLDSGRP